MRREWILKRNCSLTPQQFGLAYLLQCGALLAVASVFTAVSGSLMVLGFALFVMAAVGMAFLHFARHACDHEHIVIEDGGVIIEWVNGDMVERLRLDPCWLRIQVPSRYQDLIRLEARGVRVDVGRYVQGTQRQRLAHELLNELHAGQFRQGAFTDH